MTPIEKANDLVNKMQLDWGCNCCHNDWAKDCALIAVDMIIKNLPSIIYIKEANRSFENGAITYWKEVKQEIEKL
jgi:hypothetical protein